MISLREAFGNTLVSLASDYNFVVLDADVAGGTCTDIFKKQYPERFIQCGIAEQNMMSAASGLANSGLIPIVTAYGVFATLRPLDQIRNSIAYPKANVKIVASHPGLDVGPDGATHQAIEDLAVMRSIPNMVVISPADDIELLAATRFMLDYKGPVYMRSGRSPVPRINNSDYKFKLGKPSSLKKGDGKTVVLATGIMVHRALEAAQNSSASVINISSIKPLDKKEILAYLQNAKKVITCEDHSIIGGLGSAVSEVIAEANVNAKLTKIGIADKFGMSGESSELATRYNISSQDIKHAIEQ